MPVSDSDAPASVPPGQPSPSQPSLDQPSPGQATPDQPAADGSGRSRLATLVKAAGMAIAVLAVALCVLTLAREWQDIQDALGDARPGWLLLGLLAAAGGMTGLGLLWWRCLQVFDAPARRRDAVAWYFGGELGKYVPGGVWPVLGRGELAARAGISRTTGYVTTLICYAAMCVAAAVVCGVLAPFVALDGAGLSWGWLMLALIPLGLGALHPAVLGRLLVLGAKLTRGRVQLEPRPWRTMLGLTGWSIATWLLVGAASVCVTEALAYSQQPARVAFAAVAAWIIGFLAIPVPAGAGLRELVFLAISGLDSGPAVAVAAIARLLFIAVDAGGGLLGLWAARRTSPARNPESTESTGSADSAPTTAPADGALTNGSIQ
ncbi:lysylphosphatidylglycerol synthase domain-containing protein [Jatrophihabitans sp.]|uniref:lysylphosphatidylglycerol synthase domain-containing protein n=1 Tax=Jatrophihabitans sp. TaxID=1932789 RepID=UPI002C6554D0|nr:lysylphosphatidylglycerol synthase domain-containing protein [Jatrophihabitans sp.]